MRCPTIDPIDTRIFITYSCLSLGEASYARPEFCIRLPIISEITTVHRYFFPKSLLRGSCTFDS